MMANEGRKVRGEQGCRGLEGEGKKFVPDTGICSGTEQKDAKTRRRSTRLAADF